MTANFISPSYYDFIISGNKDEYEITVLKNLWAAVLKQYLYDLRTIKFEIKYAKTERSLKKAKFEYEKLLEELNISELNQVCESLSISFYKFRKHIEKTHNLFKEVA